jgi:hypothetical protein
MTTRLQLRTAIREILEDTSSAPLWSDAALNEYLAVAMRAYGARFPRQATAATDPIPAAAISAALPAGLLATEIVAVRDASGRDVPRASQRTGSAPSDTTGLIQGWSAWAGTLRLQRPAAGDEVGVWAIDYLTGRELAGDDVSQQPIESGDEPIVVALAAAQAMKRRLVEDAKRGAPLAGPAAAVATFMAEAERLIAARKRRVRGGFMTLA